MKTETQTSEQKRISQALSNEFLSMLDIKGLYNPIINLVKQNKDLHLEFKGNLDMLNKEVEPDDEAVIILYKGNRLFTLHRNGKIDMTEEFCTGFTLKQIPKNMYLYSKDDVTKYIDEIIPFIFFNIAKYYKPSMEIEYEQLLIRENNLEKRVNSEYLMVYNQPRYILKDEIDKDVKEKRIRFDVMAVKWPQHSRQSITAKVNLALIEIKYALNPEISEAHRQLERYHEYLTSNYENLCEETQLILKQKLQLRLIERKENQVKKLENLSINKDSKSAEIILYLVDYNPYSCAKDKMIKAAKQLEFANQIRIADGGLGMWDINRKRWQKV